MRKGWDRLQFGDVLKLDVRKAPVVDGALYPIVGVLAYGRGLLYRDPVSSGSTSYRELNLIRPDQLVYSKLKAFEGAITVAPADLTEAYASGEFPTFTATARVLPTFLRLMTQRSELWEAMAANSKGLGGRRERLNPIDFLALSACFPPLPEQRRILDLMAAVDDAVDAASSEVRAAHDAAAALRVTTFSTDRTVVLGDVYEVTVGKQLQSKATAGEKCGYLRAGNIADGSLDLREIKTMLVTEQELERLVLRDGDVVIVEGGNGYGKSAKWTGTGQPMAYQNHVLRVRPTGNEYDTEYAFQWARFNHENGLFAPTGSGIPNLGAGRVRLMPIAEATPARRQRMSLLRATDEAEALAREAEKSLQGLRSHVLNVLLAGNHEIPESYDELMGMAS